MDIKLKVEKEMDNLIIIIINDLRREKERIKNSHFEVNDCSHANCGKKMILTPKIVHIINDNYK